MSLNRLGWLAINRSNVTWKGEVACVLRFISGAAMSHSYNLGLEEYSYKLLSVI